MIANVISYNNTDSSGIGHTHIGTVRYIDGEARQGDDDRSLCTSIDQTQVEFECDKSECSIENSSMSESHANNNSVETNNIKSDNEWIGMMKSVSYSHTNNNNYDVYIRKMMKSSFDADRFERCLKDHPNRELVARTINGMRIGNKIGYYGERIGNIPVRNYVENKYKELVNKKLYQEIDKGYIAGPFVSPPLSNMFYSPLKAIPKDNSGEDIRLLLNLSYPYGGGINQYEEEKSLSYETLDEICQLIYDIGSEATIYKFDVKSAYRHIIIHRDDHHLLGFTWLGHYFYDTRGSFGGKHSTYLWEEVGQLIQWILMNYFGISITIIKGRRVGGIKRWVDDFIGVSANMVTAQQDYSKMQAACKYLGIQVHKLEPPTRITTHLGIGINVNTRTLYIPDNKKLLIIEVLNKWLNKRTCTKQQLQSLIGKLFHLSIMIRPGRAFLGRLLQLLREHHYLLPHYHVKLPAIIYHDIQWWIDFVPKWSGNSIMTRLYWPVTQNNNSGGIDMMAENILIIEVDACNSGSGGRLDNHWFASQWSEDILSRATRLQSYSMPFLECYALAQSIYTFLPWIRGRLVLVRSDCKPVCDGVTKGYSSETMMMSVIRAIFHMCALYDIQLRVLHISGVENIYADMLSRGKIQEFLVALPTANPTPLNIQHPILL